MKKVVRLTEGDLVNIVKKVIKEEKEILEEQFGLALGITLFRQTAFSKTNRLVRHLKKALRRSGLESSSFTDHNLKDFVLCLGEYSKEVEGKFSGRGGMKNLARQKGKKEQHKQAFESFKNGLDERILKCLTDMSFTGDKEKTAEGIKGVVLSTIQDFANNKWRIS